MGDRGNIEVRQKHGSVFLYSHRGGSEICATLAIALNKGRGRWSDPSYLTRIIFNELQGDDRGTTGFGISVGQPDDNEYDIPTLFWCVDEHPSGVNGQCGDRDHITCGLRVIADDGLMRADYDAEDFVSKFHPPDSIPPGYVRSGDVLVRQEIGNE